MSLRGARRAMHVIRAALDRPRLWRVCAALAVLLLCVVLALCAQGSLTVLTRRPAAGAGGADAPGWTRWCTRGTVRRDRVRLAFCARVDGRVVGSTRGPSPGEAHVAVIGGFHLTIVRLPEGARRPSLGSHVVAVGPLLRARDGQREIQAFEVQGA